MSLVNGRIFSFDLREVDVESVRGAKERAEQLWERAQQRAISAKSYRRATVSPVQQNISQTYFFVVDTDD